jgi:hypothetical protein
LYFVISDYPITRIAINCCYYPKLIIAIMHQHADNTPENKSQAIANSLVKQQGDSDSAFYFDSNRTEAVAQRKLQDAINNSSRIQQWKANSEMMNNSAQVKQLRSYQAMADNFTAQKKQLKQNSLPVFNNTAPIQRKLVVDNLPFTPPVNAAETLKTASADQFVRHYQSEKEMTDHLVDNKPSSVGFIKSLALWYDLPYLNSEFFVFGESHAAVTGASLKAASNITKPILDEKLTGWNAGEDQDEDKDQGLDENSSKLLRALEVWTPQHPTAQQPQAGPAPALPAIPQGEESVRETQRGSYKLVVKGDGGASKLWTPDNGAQAQAVVAYDVQGPAYTAIKELFPIVFEDEIDEDELNDFYGALGRGWELFGKMYDKTYNFFFDQAQQPLGDWTVRSGNVRRILKEGTEKKVKANYKKMYDATADAASKFKAPGSDNLKTPDEYRNEFILSAILKAKASGTFAFATMGNNHLTALKERLAKNGIPYITMDDFYNTYSNVAIELASAKLDEEIETFLTGVKEARVVPTEARVAALLKKLNSKGYPVSGSLREDLTTLLGFAKLYGFKDFEPPVAESENERQARAMGWI